MDYDPFLMMQDEGKVYGTFKALPPPSFRSVLVHGSSVSHSYSHASSFDRYFSSCSYIPNAPFQKTLTLLTNFAIAFFTGFTISLYEWEPTIPTLWNTVKREWCSRFTTLMPVDGGRVFF